MAKLIPNLGLIGAVGEFSYYKMKRVDAIVVRKKGGPTKKQIKKSPNFDMVRRNNQEFGARSSVTSWILRAAGIHKRIADYNIAGPLHSLMKKIQVMDDKGDLGQREILLTRHPQLLEGFSFTRNHIFDSIIRTPLQYEIAKKEGTAVLHIPALTPGINFFPPFYNPMFKISAIMGLVGDLFYTDDKYRRLNEFDGRVKHEVDSGWLPMALGCEPLTLDMKLPLMPSDEHYTIILSVAIFVGNVITPGNIQQVPHIGAGKILGIA